jgi:hypothetical protein
VQRGNLTYHNATLLLANNLVLYSRHHTWRVLVQMDNILLVVRKDKNGMLLELRIDSGSKFKLESTNDGSANGGGDGSGRRGTNDSRMRGRSKEGGDSTGSDHGGSVGQEINKSGD